jgi:RHH-type proline utilization regulon transcriptional repressor/proline dehydrogenase/delta 1-pyrroline-5-carboxylate dehydrogenase
LFLFFRKERFFFFEKKKQKTFANLRFALARDAYLFKCMASCEVRRMVPFRPDFAPDDTNLARALLAAAPLTPDREARVDSEARHMIGAIRGRAGGIGGVEQLLREYSLTTPEGLALMVLAEGLLRVPDDATADRLIEDKLGQGGFASHAHQSDAMLINASAWALGLSARLVGPQDTPEGILRGVVRRLGLPTVRGALRQAMRVMGSHFVLGQSIEDALARAGSRAGRLFRYSFDMLGEGARTADDAERYQASYAAAIEAIGNAAGNKPLPDRPGISVKLSALHPRYEAVSRARVMVELVPRVRVLARAAAIRGLNFTIDAEEADRLELSMDVLQAVAADKQLAGWDGFGLAIQAYGKRAVQAIDYVAEVAASLDRRFMVRLVKGAYWDTEVKRAQERGLADYPVFTRKPMTDLNYVACADRLLSLRPRIYPQFATHNALTVATVFERAGGTEGYEFQRLHGMGNALYAAFLERHPQAAVRTYAPVGIHRDLLAYLVRRLLENGANSSFVSIAADPDVPVDALLRRPEQVVGRADRARHGGLPLPEALYGPGRRNSAGVEFGHEASLNALLAEITGQTAPVHARPLGAGADTNGVARTVVSPNDAAGLVGDVVEATPAGAEATLVRAQAGFRAWAETPVGTRAAALERAASLLEERRGRFLALLADEGGKTLDDGLAELREAVDFLRYYAVQAKDLFGEPETLPGPTGELNQIRRRGRGVFVCISPWNFPLAIFMGQVAAALAAGNAVVAKPAEQTPLVAYEAVRLLHEAGVPASALYLVTGAGDVGASLVGHKLTAGVAFTGSTEVAWAINKSLAAKRGPIVPLIAETGGINAMIVDATALPEQVVDDAVMSAFRSAGQRCSALRLLAVQDDVADKIIAMLAGAAAELKLGDPRDPSTHLGPVIDAEAQARLLAHIAKMKSSARCHYAGVAPSPGYYVAPHIFEIDKPGDLAEEIFGPVLHVVRYRARALDELVDAIEATGYGLTLGIHTRIDATAQRIADRLSVGNVYVNRNMIGAVVGVQPFGGSGLSGTGPKAGGPDYLRRFGVEQSISINTAAAGGNAALLSAEE